jgi:hypothetical protein
MAVKVAFQETGGGTAAAAHRVMIPKNAVQSREGRDIIFVVQHGNAERRAVTVTDAQNDDAAVSAGVSAGETVIVDPPAGLTDGAAVKEKKL